MHDIDSAAVKSRLRDYPGAVAVLCGGLLLVELLRSDRRTLVLALLVSLAIAVAGGAPIRRLLRALLVPLGFVLVSAGSLCWSVSLRPMRFDWVPSALPLAATIALRCLAALATTLLFAFNVPFAQWLHLFRRMGVPEELLDVVHLTYRYTFVLGGTLNGILRAQRNRLGHQTTLDSLRAVANALATVVVHSVEVARRLERGLAARGYDGEMRVLLPESKTRFFHLVLAAAIPCALVGLSCMS